MLKNYCITLIFIFFLVAPVLFCSSFILAGEEITITTYYPSPYGIYNHLQANRIAVGDTSGDGFLTDSDIPTRDGDIRLKPQAGNPASWPSGAIGQFSYSRVQDSLYHYNGSTWVASGGGGAGGGSCYVSYSGACLSGFINRGDLGSYGYCYGTRGTGSWFDDFAYFRPPGASCGHLGLPTTNWSAVTSGNACLCCQ